MNASDTTPKLRFYGRRKGRPLTKYQSELIASELPRLSVPLAHCSFTQGQRVWLEIGFGGGEHLAHQAALFPEVTFIGAEAFLNGVASLLTHIARGNQQNVQIFHGDARLLIANLTPNSVEKIFILYPDPWPKARHGKRRLIQSEFLECLSQILKINGEIVIATDDEDYADHIPQAFQNLPQFAGPTTKEGNNSPPPNWIQTRYEARAKRLGNNSYYFNYKKIAG